MSRPDPRVALLEAASPGYREFFHVVTGDRTLTITAFEASDGAYPEARVHVIRKPFDWDATPKDDPPSIGDDQNLLVMIWQILGRDS